MGESKDEFDVHRKAARGRAEVTPVLITNILFLVIGVFVGLVVLTVLLIYYFA